MTSSSNSTVDLFDRILFLGNSITLHPPKADIGWEWNWGMAASAQEKDYVHILMRQIRQVHAAAQFMVRNIYDFETQYWDYDLTHLQEQRDFSSSCLVIRIGENVDGQQVKTKNFEYYLDQMIHYVNPGDAGQVICTNCFWDSPAVSAILEAVARKNGYLFADIRHLGQDERNMAIGQFWHEGVAHHPSDRGMAEIAEAIWPIMEKERAR